MCCSHRGHVRGPIGSGLEVESYEDANEGQICAQALVGIEYEARVELVDAAPETVVVEHDGSPVTTEKR